MIFYFKRKSQKSLFRFFRFRAEKNKILKLFPKTVFQINFNNLAKFVFFQSGNEFFLDQKKFFFVGMPYNWSFYHP